MHRASRPPGDRTPAAGGGGGDPHDDDADEGADDDASSRRLASLDDQLGGLGPSSPDAPSATETLATEDLTPELAKRIDTILVLRMAVLGTEGSKGPRVFGKYHVLRRIGEGGFAAVFEVVDTKLGRREALKIARPEILLDASKTRRFLREARLASRVTHPHIVAIHEVGEHDRLPYIAEELCGESLERWLGRHPGPVAPRIAAETVRLLAEAVQVAHRAGVLHRDIKPANVLLVPAADGPLPAEGAVARPGPARQTVKLGDFGLSVSLLEGDDASSGTAPTEAGTTLGTPEWMAPESVEGSTCDERTDVHALGLVLDRMLTGRCIHSGRSRAEVFRRIVDGEPEPADRIVPGLPADLVAVCLKCLAKAPADRYPSAAELAVDLARFLEGRPTLARPVSRVERARRWTRRHPARAGVIAAATMALLLGGVALRERTVRLALLVSQSSLREAAARQRAHVDAVFHLRRGFETWRGGNVREALGALGASTAAEPGLADSIAGGWLLARVHGERVTILGPKEPTPARRLPPIHRIAVAPDGRRLAAAGADGRLHLLSLAADGTAVGDAIAVAAADELNDVVFAPDGATVATGGEDGTVRLWNAADGSLRREVAAGGAAVFGLAFTPDGRSLAWAGVDRAIRVVGTGPDAAPPLERRPFDRTGVEPGSEPPDIEAIRFVDGSRLVVAIGREVCVVEIPSGEVGRRFSGDEGHVFGLDVSPDGLRLLATGWFERVGRVWDLDSGELLLTLPAHPLWVQRGSFTPDGTRIVTACKDGVVRIFDALDGQLLESLVGHVETVWDAAAHRSGAILSSGSDGTVRVWEPAVARWGGRVLDPPLSDVIAAVPLPEQGALALVARSGAALTLDPVSGTVLRRWRLAAEGEGVRGVVAEEGGTRIAVVGAHELRVDAAAGPADRLVHASATIHSAAWGPEGRLYAAVDPGPAVAVPGDTSRLVAWRNPSSESVEVAEFPVRATSLAVTIRPRARMAVAVGTAITLFDLAPDGMPVGGSARVIADLAPRVSPGIRLAWSPDGARLAYGSTGGLAGLLDARTGEHGAVMASFARGVRGILWSDDGLSLVVADEECVRLHDATTGTTFDEIRPGWRIASLAWGKNRGARGPTLVVAGEAGRTTDDGVRKGRVLLLDLGRRLPLSR